MIDVKVVKPGDRSENTSQTPNMLRESAISSDICDSRGLWVGYVSAPPGSSGAHHHGDAESGIYVLSGHVRMHFGDDLEKSVDAEAGDFIYVPANTVHVEENLSEAGQAELIVARNSSDYLVVNVPSPRDCNYPKPEIPET